MNWYPSVEEKTVEINVSDDKRMKAILRGSWTMPLVILVHGRPSGANATTHYLAARYFHEKGFATLRLFLYGNGKNERNLVDCTLGTHVDDYEAAVAFARDNGAKRIFSMGHSYGGLVVLKSKVDVNALSLWDAAHGTFFEGDHDERYPEYKEVLMQNMPIVVGVNGKGYLEPTAMIEDEKTWGNNSDWAKKDFPLQIIHSDVKRFVEASPMYFEAANDPKELVHIKGAGHQFINNDDIARQLFDFTLAWFSKY